MLSLSKTRIVFIVLTLVFASQLLNHSVYSQDSDDDDLQKKQQEIEEIQQELGRLAGEKQTLASTVAFLDKKIQITQLQINQTEKQLDTLSRQIQDLFIKIEDLDVTLNQITQLLIRRVGDTYKRSRINPMASLLVQNDLNQMLSLYKYLQSSQKNDRMVMYQLESTRVEFDHQKTLKEEKQQELDALSQTLVSQKASLDKQQIEKQYLLETTKNDEKRFQAMLAQKMAELEAIQSIIAGQGDETEVGDIQEGDTIASVIPGPSTCSTGGHLHFEVAKDGVHRNPAQYLQSRDVIWDNAPDGPFDFSGSWSWPITDPVRITQGYGMTYYASTMRYYGGSPHTGIDMINKSDYSVKAVKPGTLYRGGIGCRGGTLRYVRVKHKDDNLSTYYLHVNYI